MRKIVISVFVYVIILNVSSGQSTGIISGQAIDEISKEPLQDVNIIIVESPAGDAGNFETPLPAAYYSS